MFAKLPKCVGLLIKLTATVALMLAPGVLFAGQLGFRNDTNTPVIVQGLSIVNNVPRLGKRHVLQPGDTGWDQIAAPGDKLIIVADAKQPTRILYKDTIKVGMNVQFYAIEEDTDAQPTKPELTPATKKALPGKSVKPVPDRPVSSKTKSSQSKPAAPVNPTLSKVKLVATTPPKELPSAGGTQGKTRR